MGIWKDKDTGNWKFVFQMNKKKYGGGGHKTKKAAEAARAQRRLSVARTPIREIEIKHKILSTEKYQELYRNPNITVAHIFDSVMIDLDLPPRFKDLRRMFGNGHGKTKIPANLRMKILERDNFTCKLCGGKPPDVRLNVDHILAFSLGGITEERNLRTLCQQCNFGKADKPFFVQVKIPGATIGGNYDINTQQGGVMGAMDMPEIIEEGMSRMGSP